MFGRKKEVFFSSMWLWAVGYELWTVGDER